MSATQASVTSSTASPGTSEAVWPSGPRPRWIRSSVGGEPARLSSVCAYCAAAAGRSSASTGMACRLAGGSGAWLRRLSRRCLKLRSSLSAGATRSSTCTTCTWSQGTCSFASSRSITQGVWPPLTAKVNRPRSFTAALACSATSVAARLATASGSASTSIFMRSAPSPDGCPGSRRGSPGSRARSRACTVPRCRARAAVPP